MQPPSCSTTPALQHVTLPALVLTMRGELLWSNDALSALVGTDVAAGCQVDGLGLGDERAWSAALSAARAGERAGELRLVWSTASGRAIHVQVHWARDEDPASGQVHLVAFCVADTRTSTAESRTPRDGGLVVETPDGTRARPPEAHPGHPPRQDDLTAPQHLDPLPDGSERALGRDAVSSAALTVDLDELRLADDRRRQAVGDEGPLPAAGLRAEPWGSTDTRGPSSGDLLVMAYEQVDHSPSGGAAPARRKPLAASGGNVSSHARSLDLRAALAADTLTMRYQPIVELATGAVAGIEARAGWEHATDVGISPESLVLLAEDAGLAPELARWVVRQGVGDVAALHSRGALPSVAHVAVNLSASDLLDRGLEDAIIRCAELHGVRSDRIVLEVTENAIMDDTARAASLFERLRSQGFGVAVDDFGTGHSSFAVLRDLPIAKVKIDKSLVGSMVEDRDALGIVSALVHLAGAVSATVAAEGVSTPRQAQLLESLGCHQAQGPLWSAPLTLDELWTGWLRQTRGAGTAQPGGAPARRRPPGTTAAVGVEHGLAELLRLHRSGASLSTIAAALNRSGFTTPTGTRWHRNTVARVTSEHLLGATVVDDVVGRG